MSFLVFSLLSYLSVFFVHPGHTYPDLMGLITYDSFIQHLRHPHADLLVLIHMIPYALLDQIIDF